jgi:serine/threonine-protein kinase
MASEPPAKGPRRAIHIDKYKVLAHIATGGMGAVYKARDTQNNRDVALKVLTREMASKPAMVERFKREARHAEQLRHENIVTVYEFKEFKGTYFIAMEFVDGIDLYEYIVRKKTLDPEEARQIMVQACRALDHAHQFGIVHRDIKPSNFLIARDQGKLVVKLTDLGLSRQTTAEEFRVTRAGTTVGTVDYISPEQARDSGVADIRSDLYSLGCTWYHMLTGRPPFPDGGLAERLHNHMTIDPPEPRQFNPRVSEATLAVLRRLTAKAPEDRYQTPAELLSDLLLLESRARPSSSREILAGLARAEDESPVVDNSRTEVMPISPPSRRKLGPRQRDPEGQEDLRPAPVSRTRWVYVLVAAVVLLLISAILVIMMRGGNSPPVSTPDPESKPEQPSPAPRPVDGPEKAADPVRPVQAPAKLHWPALYQPTVALNVEQLQKEMEQPWAEPAIVPDGATVFRVGRTLAPQEGKTFSSLAAACAAARPGQTTIIEIHDNGPVFEVASTVAGGHLIVRAAPGFRPLLVWDVQRNLDGRGKAKPEPLTFLDVRNGSLTLEGVEVVLKWPDAANVPATILQVQGGDLNVRDCTFSLAGKHRDGVRLARFSAGEKAGRCRFTRCHARGARLVALDTDAPAAEVLFDRCLIIGGEPALVQVRAGEERTTSLRAVRSTIICGETLLRVQPARDSDKRPAVSWFGWDVLLARSNDHAGGTLVELGGDSQAEKMSWRAVNCLYAGWRTLLGSATPILADDLAAWRKQWGHTEGDATVRDPWPAAAFHDPAENPANTYHTAGTPVGFAATAVADTPLGCPLEELPVARDTWLSLTYEPFISGPVEMLTDGPLPAIPAPGDNRYHGERLDLNQIDLGAYLANVQKTRQLGPRVVLHLSGKGERPTSPVYVKGTHLVLYFEPAAEDAAALALMITGREPVKTGALIEVEDGSLDVINGDLRLPDFPVALVPPYVLKVRGGDLRLHRCQLRGPAQHAPKDYRGLLDLEGSGDTAAGKARTCAVHESVIVSGRTGVSVHGVGTRLVMRNSVLVAGTDALEFDLGSSFQGRANLQCLLEHTTVAAKRAVVHLADSPSANLPAEPLIVQTRECALLNPFAGAPNPAGLLLYDGDALAHGLLVWQSDGDAFDKRLHFGAASMSQALPDKAEGHTVWSRLWGTAGIRRPVLDLALTQKFDNDRWQLERLAIPVPRPSPGTPPKRPPGADLTQLGILKKPKGPSKTNQGRAERRPPDHSACSASEPVPSGFSGRACVRG